MMLITLEEAKAHLRVDHDDEDGEITAKVHEASSAILTYLDGAPVGEPERDEQGALVRDEEGGVVYVRDDEDSIPTRYEVKAAVKILLAELYENREADQDGEINNQYGYGYLPRPVVALLYPLRKPAFA